MTTPILSTPGNAARIRGTVAGRAVTAGAAAAWLALMGPWGSPVSAQAAASVILSEVHPTGSSAGYEADWFEVTNTGTTAIDLVGWRVDDGSNAFASAVALRGVTAIPPGKSAVFIEGDETGATDAARVAAFCTAWFGTSTPPIGFRIGVYGGSGVGLSSSGDAVNLFDAAGSPRASVSFGSATAGVTFDNAAGLGGILSTLSAVGVHGAFLSVSGGEIGSPGRVAAPPALTSVDLSRYRRVGRYDLPEPTRTTAPPDSVLAQEVSGVTYDWDTDTLFVVGDGGTSVVQVTKTGELIDSMTLAPGSSPQGTDFYDPEGITYVGGGRFVLAEERDRQLVLFTYAAGTTLSRAGAQTVKLGTFVPNIGIEGLSWDPLTAGFVAVKEKEPQGVFQTGVDFAAGTATNGSPTAEGSVNLFDPALLGFADLADVFALSNLPTLTGTESSHLLLLSQESGRILNVDRTGQVFSALTIAGDPGNPLDVPSQQHEGLTMDGDGFLYVVSENGGGDFDHPQLWVYAPSSEPNAAPTAIALVNAKSSIAEDTSTASRIKLADVVVTDDGLGTNDLSVTGADAASFEVDGTGLYLRSGTVLDFEARSGYAVSVEVDDVTVGASPDASVAFALAVTDVVEGTPGPSVVITEVAPWGSGESPAAADWFEVTNTGTTVVTLTGWKVDDGSGSFAAAAPLSGVTSIAPRESVLFMETSAPATTKATFLDTWFGASPPASLQVGSYSGSGLGLSTGGDAVNLYDATGALMASVSFGASPTGPFPTFDNAEGLNGTTISRLSVVGVNGAFAARNDPREIGSPGLSPVPEGKLIITEVAPWSSGNSPVAADWFEVTNTGVAPVDLTGWKVDDSSESPVAAVPLNGVASIAPGESVIFVETADPVATRATFLATWFGAGPPPGLQVGSYTGSGIGLSTGGDAVNLYDPSGALKAHVDFKASPAGPSFPTFDNAAGVNGATLSLLSVAGVDGAFAAVGDANEIGSPGTAATTFVLPSSARAQGLGGAFYTTDLSVANTGEVPVTVVLKFLGNGIAGAGGPERSVSIAGGESRNLPDVLGSVFGLAEGFGAIQISSPSEAVRVASQTSTPGFGGTFGQSVPAARLRDLLVAGGRVSILAVREDASFRTNLVLANPSVLPVDVDVSLVAQGSLRGEKRFSLPALGMIQVTRVVRELGVTDDVSGGHLELSTPTAGGAVAAYASVIDNVTNDPRTLLPLAGIASLSPETDYWIFPSSARAAGFGGAFYTTDLTVGCSGRGGGDVARYVLKFLGNGVDGRSGPEVPFEIRPSLDTEHRDVLSSVFQRTSDFGAIRMSSSAGSGCLSGVAQTSTPGFGGTLGQSVPAVPAGELIRSGRPASILAVREDGAFRTNLILTNATGSGLEVEVQLRSDSGVLLAAKRYALPPLGMTQVTRVVRDLGVQGDVVGGRLVLSVLDATGALAAYASVIDDVTNDPRTLLPR
jgi:uncharacterized protein YjiK